MLVGAPASLVYPFVWLDNALLLHSMFQNNILFQDRILQKHALLVPMTLGILSAL